MTTAVVVIFSLCFLQAFVSSAGPPKRILIDTPEKYEHLKHGLFDEHYRIIDVTSGAHPQVLLQPHYFENSSFLIMNFISPAKEGENKITIFPGDYPRAEVYFRDRVNPLGGVPKNYINYYVSFVYPSTPNDENINSILQWRKARSLDIYDQENVVISLMHRIKEFSRLDQLSKLGLAMQDENYKQINVATFIENLRSLEEISFHGHHMSERQMREFEAKNRVPPHWRGFLMKNYIYYKKQRHMFHHVRPILQD